MNRIGKITVGLVLLALAGTAFGHLKANRDTGSLVNQHELVTTLTGAAQIKANARVVTPLVRSRPLHIVLTLDLRNEARLQALVQRIQRTESLSKRRSMILTQQQFRTVYSPTVNQARAVANFLRRAGFTHVSIAPNRMLVSGDAPASVVEATFHTNLVSVVKPNGRRAFANTRPPRIPASLNDAVLAVLGLQTVHKAHTMIRFEHGTDVDSRPIKANPKYELHANAVTGHYPTEFDEIYGAGDAPTAAGVTIGVVTSGDMTNTIQALNQFTSQHNLPQVNVQVVHTNGSSSDTSGDAEWALDTQDIVGMAGGRVGKLILYTIPSLSLSNLTADFNTIVTDNQAKIINVSLGLCETVAQNTGTAASEDQIFQQAVAQGQTISVSSGDSGADECPNDGSSAPIPSWPASSQYVVAVGGTTLNASSNTWFGETVWNGTGGSPSTFEPMPSWQQGVGQNAGHNTRGVPDIAFDADPSSGALVIVHGQLQQIGGTSLASPLFVGLWARVIAAHGTNVGFAAPLIYQLPATDFHDVTSGNNGGESAAPGWDYTTGFGSMKIAAVVNDIGGGNPPPSSNNPPTAQNGSVTTTEGQPVSGTLSASDPDGDSLTFSIVGQPNHGAVQITNVSTGAFTYSPDSNYSGADSFTFKANDGQVDSNIATESITVKPASACPPGFTRYSGSVSQGNDSYEPNGSYYYASGGIESGRLHGPAGADFDLYLYKYSYWYGWQVVARSISSTPNESIDYSGSAGYYLWDIHAYSGSGHYGFCLRHP